MGRQGAKTDAFKDVQCLDLSQTGRFVLDNIAPWLNQFVVPFYVRHERRTNDCDYIGLVTEAYVCKRALNFKVLYPYNPACLTDGKLFQNVSAAAGKMYKHYRKQAAVENNQVLRHLDRYNSSGWTHLVAQCRCPREHTEHGGAHGFAIKLKDLFPQEIRNALAQHAEVMLPLAAMPHQVHVNHSLQLDHLAPTPKRIGPKPVGPIQRADAYTRKLQLHMESSGLSAADKEIVWGRLEHNCALRDRGHHIDAPDIAIDLNAKSTPRKHRGRPPSTRGRGRPRGPAKTAPLPDTANPLFIVQQPMELPLY